MFRQHPASHLLRCCPPQAQQLIRVAMWLLQNQHLSMEMTILTPTLPALLKSSSSIDWYIYIFGLRFLLIV